MKPNIKRLGVSEKRYEWQLGATTNKIKIRTLNIILINDIGTQTNSTTNYTLAISDSGENIHIANKATPKIYPVIMSKKITEMLPDGSKMEFSYVATIQLSGLTRKYRQIHISPKIRTAPLVSLGVLYNDGWTNTLGQQYTTYQNIVHLSCLIESYWRLACPRLIWTEFR